MMNSIPKTWATYDAYLADQQKWSAEADSIDPVAFLNTLGDSADPAMAEFNRPDLIGTGVRKVGPRYLAVIGDRLCAYSFEETGWDPIGPARLVYWVALWFASERKPGPFEDVFTCPAYVYGPEPAAIEEPAPKLVVIRFPSGRYLEGIGLPSTEDASRARCFASAGEAEAWYRANATPRMPEWEEGVTAVTHEAPR